MVDKTKTGRRNGRCQVCRHTDRFRIEYLVACGSSRRSVGKRFGIEECAIARHWVNHVMPSQKAVLAAKALKPGADLEKVIADEPMSLVEHLKDIRAKLYLVFNAAVETGQAHNASLMSARLHENARILGHLTGELVKNAPSNITNILLHPDLMELVNAVRLAVGPYPEARKAVIEAFDRLEAKAMKHFTSTPSNSSPREPLTIEGKVNAT